MNGRITPSTRSGVCWWATLNRVLGLDMLASATKAMELAPEQIPLALVAQPRESYDPRGAGEHVCRIADHGRVNRFESG